MKSSNNCSKLNFYPKASFICKPINDLSEIIPCNLAINIFFFSLPTNLLFCYHLDQYTEIQQYSNTHCRICIIYSNNIYYYSRIPNCYSYNHILVYLDKFRLFRHQFPKLLILRILFINCKYIEVLFNELWHEISWSNFINFCNAHKLT